MANIRNLEYFEWVDHWGAQAGGWLDHNPDEWVKTEYLVRTVGFVLSETKNQVLVASTVADNGQYCGVQTIVKKLLVTRKLLKKNVRLS